MIPRTLLLLSSIATCVACGRPTAATPDIAGFDEAASRADHVSNSVALAAGDLVLDVPASGTLLSNGYFGFEFEAPRLDSASRIRFVVEAPVRDPIVYVYGPRGSGGWGKAPLLAQSDVRSDETEAVEVSAPSPGTRLLVVVADYDRRPGVFTITARLLGDQPDGGTADHDAGSRDAGSRDGAAAVDAREDSAADARVAPPPNDTCESALEIDISHIGGSIISGTTCGAAPVDPVSSCAWSNDGPTVYYRIPALIDLDRPPSDPSPNAFIHVEAPAGFVLSDSFGGGPARDFSMSGAWGAPIVLEVRRLPEAGGCDFELRVTRVY